MEVRKSADPRAGSARRMLGGALFALLTLLTLSAHAFAEDPPKQRQPWLGEPIQVGADGTARSIYRPEFRSAPWLRDQLKESGKELLPGQLLSLGNIGILRPLQEGNPRGPMYTSNQFRLE